MVALGDVADDGQHVRALVSAGAESAERQLDAHVLTGFAASEQLDCLTIRVAGARGGPLRRLLQIDYQLRKREL